jgi:hypothetical protein
MESLKQGMCSYEWRNRSAKRDNCPTSLYVIPASMVVLTVTIKIAATIT